MGGVHPPEAAAQAGSYVIWLKLLLLAVLLFAVCVEDALRPPGGHRLGGGGGGGAHFPPASALAEAAARAGGVVFREAALVSPSTAALVRLCRAARGRGAAHYAALPGARVVGASRGQRHPDDAACVTAAVEGVRNNVTHCCEATMKMMGMTGNLLTQSHVLRFYAELNSCAMPWIWYQGDNLPESQICFQGDFRAAQQWPAVPGWEAAGDAELTNSIDALREHQRPSQARMRFEVFPENANWQYAALSLGWDLAGDTLIGLGVRGLNAELVTGNATAERCARWAVHREACAAAGAALAAEAGGAPEGAPLRGQLEALSQQTALEGLHPWLSAGMLPERPGIRDMVRLVLDGSHALTPALRVLVAHPERTIVVHLRMDEVYQATLRDARARALEGLARGGGNDEWLGGIHLAGARWADAAPPEETDAQRLDMLEASAARADLVTQPLSFFTRVLRATRAAWDHVVIVGDPSLRSNPIFASLQAEFGALLQCVDVVTDFTALLLARQLVLSGASTFTFSAAALGRARVIHAPHVGYLSVRAHNMNAGSCLIPPDRFDERWVFHDVFRRAVRRAARVFAAQAAAARREGLAHDAVVDRAWAERVTREALPEVLHVEWKRAPLAPLPVWDDACPGDADEGVDGARGLAAALGKQPPPPPPVRGAAGGGAPDPVPLFFLTYQELVGLYRRKECTPYFFPSFERDELSGGRARDPRHTCVDDAPIATLHEVGPSYGCRLEPGGQMVAC